MSRLLAWCRKHPILPGAVAIAAAALAGPAVMSAALGWSGLGGVARPGFAAAALLVLTTALGAGGISWESRYTGVPPPGPDFAQSPRSQRVGTAMLLAAVGVFGVSVVLGLFA